MSEEFGALWDPENFTFTYKMSKETYELYDEQQILYPDIECMCVFVCVSMCLAVCEQCMRAYSQTTICSLP